MLNRKYFSRRFLWLLVFLVAFAFYFFWNCLPYPLFNTPTSTVLTDRNGNLLGALIANDGQWRFPYNGNVSKKFKEAIVEFEDKRFYRHPGVDPLAIGRAISQHIQSKKVKSGGSTLSMQVIRLSR